MEEKIRLGRVFVEENSRLKRLSSIFKDISARYNIDQTHLVSILKTRKKYISIPASIFNNQLSPLENVVLYLHMNIGLSQTEIANILARDHTTVWTTLEKAKEKMGSIGFEVKEGILIPISLFSNRKLSILENLARFLKTNYNMTYHEIGKTLGKDDRTIWTVVHRADLKDGTIIK